MKAESCNVMNTDVDMHIECLLGSLVPKGKKTMIKSDEVLNTN